MRRSSRRVFLLLIVVQATHSIEEYATGLYEVFAPAGLVSGLVANDLGVGFAIINSAIVAFGLWCFFVPIRSGWPSARSWAWLWVVVELANGIGHTGLALTSGGYFPGAVTAPVLLVVAAWLAALLLGDPLPRGAAA
jgi:hypothetical protein